MKDKNLEGFYEFAGFRLDPKKKRLLYGESIIALTPKEFEVLLLLAENAGRSVEKDELLEKIWQETFVEEGTLTRNVSWLRKKLVAHAPNDKIIETVPKIGYRFLPKVAFIESFDQTEKAEEKPIEPEFVVIRPAASLASINKTKQSAKTNSYSAQSKKKDFVQLWIIPAVLIILLGGYVFYKYYSRQSPQMILAAKIVPFSGLPGREISPSFSPDGKQLVYAWDGGNESANSNIYIKMIGTGEPVRLTNTPNDEIAPIFSPDGKSIVFVRVLPTHNEIILIPALGGAERKIYEQASYASVSFSPDGKTLAIVNLDLSQNDAGIFLLDLNTGAKIKLTHPEAPAVDHTPRFSPDGKSLAFVRHFGTFRREVFVIPSTGGEAQQITNDNTRVYGLAWNKDNQNLFFTSYRKLNQLNLWKTSIKGEEPQLIPTGSKSLINVAVSPDGQIAAIVEETADENIWELVPNSQPHLLIRSVRADHSQQFSPDGTQIVFASDRTGEYEIWLADADGKNQRQLTFSNGSAGSPRFSPDGKSIIYDAQAGGVSSIFMISVNGGEPRRLTNDDKSNSLPAWSADGQTIFFISNRAGSDQIWKMPASGGEPIQITKQGAFEMFVTPDGKNIIYSKGSGKAGLCQVSIDGSDEKPIPELVEAGNWRSWTIAPTGIYYTALNTQPPYQIKFFDFSTRQIKTIANINKPPLNYYSNLTVSPDGTKILYARQDQSASTISLAEFEESK